MTKMLWYCQKCNDLIESDSTIVHDMNWCSCRKTAVDSEEYYARYVGKPVFLASKNVKDKTWKVLRGKRT